MKLPIIEDLKIPLFNWLELSLIEACTRRCEFCPRVNIDEFPNQDLEMSPLLYTKLAKDLVKARFEGTVLLCGYGEPLMYSYLFDLISMFSPMINVEMVTNGDLLTKDILKELSIAGIGTIWVSLYDGNHQIEKFNDLFSYFPNIKYVLRNRWEDKEHEYGLPTSGGALTNRAGMVINSKGISGECFYPTYFLMVDWNGDVFMCPQDWRKRKKMGNVMFSSLKEIWEDKILEKERKRLLSGDRTVAPCKFCDVVGTKKGKEIAEEWRNYYASKSLQTP